MITRSLVITVRPTLIPPSSASCSTLWFASARPTVLPPLLRTLSNNSSQSYYAILGVGRSATAQEIKKAYFAAAKKCHPDLHPGKEAQFRLVNEAYEVLKDPASRKNYDANGGSQQQQQQQQQQNSQQRQGQQYSQQQHHHRQQRYQQQQYQQQRQHQDIFRQVWSELGFDEIDIYIKQIQREMHHAMSQAGQANFGPGWEFAHKHRALLLGTLLPITLLVRSPALTAASLRLIPMSAFLARTVLPLHLQWYAFSRLWIAAIKYVERQIDSPGQGQAGGQDQAKGPRFKGKGR